MQRDHRSLLASLPVVAVLAMAFQTSCDRLCTDRLRQMWFELSLTPSQVVPPPDAPGAGFGDVQLYEQAERTIIVSVHPMPRTDPGGPITFDTETITAVHTQRPRLVLPELELTDGQAATRPFCCLLLNGSTSRGNVCGSASVAKYVVLLTSISG